MDLSNLPQNVVAQLTKAVEDYILKNREKYFPRASALTAEQRSLLAPFFSAEDLQRARTLVLEGSRIMDPSFYSMARIMGIQNLPSFSDVAAVTFVDVIVSHERFTPSLLFHEMVHVVQYSQLGPAKFSSLYVNGFIQGGSYESIPLERNAYQLESRFSDDPSKVFSVADEVRRWNDAGRL
ncbi:MAG TPA: hypothetical protein VKW06_06490 [Candidatus Angelobacter sp.]|nr:hypothetical protein [Candidatus Angelobacter sp.]